MDALCLQYRRLETELQDEFGDDIKCVCSCNFLAS